MTLPIHLGTNIPTVTCWYWICGTICFKIVTVYGSTAPTTLNLTPTTWKYMSRPGMRMDIPTYEQNQQLPVAGRDTGQITWSEFGGSSEKAESSNINGLAGSGSSGFVLDTRRVYTGDALVYLPSWIRSSDIDSTGFWSPGSLHTLGTDGHI